MQALLNVLYAIFPFSEGTNPSALAPAALIMAGFLAAAFFGFALSVYDALKEHRN